MLGSLASRPWGSEERPRLLWRGSPKVKTWPLVVRNVKADSLESSSIISEVVLERSNVSSGSACDAKASKFVQRITLFRSVHSRELVIF